MKKPLLFLLLTFFTTAFSQIRFEKGYLINNQNEKSEVLIKNDDWSLNPTEFTYKKSDDGAEMKGKMNDVTEFGVYNFSKYVRFNGPIDQSTEDLQILDGNKNPKWVEKTVFLKQLAEGKRNLYTFSDSKVHRFFFSEEDGPIKQLIYKKYFAYGDNSNVYTNNEFRSQIATSFGDEETRKKIDNLTYKNEFLTAIFKKFNGGENSELVSDRAKSTFNFYLKGGISFTSAKLNIEDGSPVNVDFASKISPKFGVELEYVLPFRKNKWSVFLEPTYQTYKQTGKNFTNNDAMISYNVIELPVGVRHYFFIDQNSRIFLEAVATLAELKIGDNFIRYGIPGTTAEKIFDLGSQINISGGIGYSYNNKYSVSARYASKKIGNIYSISANIFSITAAYKIF